MEISMLKQCFSRTLVALTLILTVSACVSTKNVAVDDSAASQFSGKTLSVTERALPDFVAFTRGKVLFGAVGAAAMVSSGNKIVRENAIDDPANYISSILADDLVDKHSMNYIDDSGEFIQSEKITAIANAHNNSDFVLDVRTTNWSINYYPSSLSKYRVLYTAKLRLIKVADGTLFAEGFCVDDPEKSEDSPSYEALLADNAYLIKAGLRVAANNCIDQFRRDILDLPVTQLAALSPKPTKAIAKIDQSSTANPTSGDDGARPVETAHPELLAGLTSASSVEMRSAAIEIGQQNIYNDEGLFQASVNVLRDATDGKAISKKEKYLVDGLAWVALNLGHSKDDRARPVLTMVGKNEALPKKLRNHAIHAIKIMDGLVEK